MTLLTSGCFGLDYQRGAAHVSSPFVSVPVQVQKGALTEGELSSLKIAMHQHDTHETDRYRDSETQRVAYRLYTETDQHGGHKDRLRCNRFCFAGNHSSDSRLRNVCVLGHHRAACARKAG